LSLDGAILNNPGRVTLQGRGLTVDQGRAGHEEAARRVAIAKQRHRRQVLNPASKMWNWLLYLTIGYGTARGKLACGSSPSCS
jgi:hypothetical protein